MLLRPFSMPFSIFAKSDRLIQKSSLQYGIVPLHRKERPRIYQAPFCTKIVKNFQKWPLFAFFSIFLKNFKNKKNKKYRKKPAIWPRTRIKPRYTNGFRAFFASSKSGHDGHKSGQKHENGHFFEKFHEAFFTHFSPKNAKWPKKPATWPLLWLQTGHENFIFFAPFFR